MKKLEFRASAIKDMRSFDDRIKEAILLAFSVLSETGTGDVKPLAGTKGCYRLRVGGYRAEFVMSDSVIDVYLVEKRGDAYKKKSAKRRKSA
jgi:mRNA-degrading endonuclease RelE of RelBE toxin-antitoxin system